MPTFAKTRTGNVDFGLTAERRGWNDGTIVTINSIVPYDWNDFLNGYGDWAKEHYDKASIVGGDLEILNSSEAIYQKDCGDGVYSTFLGLPISADDEVSYGGTEAYTASADSVTFSFNYANVGEKSTTVITTPAATAPLVSLDVDGKSVQDGTPTPSVPVAIQSVAGANLVDPDDTTAGYLSSAGVVTAPTNNKERLTDYIELPQGMTDAYIICNQLDKASTRQMWVGVGWYDSSKTFISRPANSPASGVTEMAMKYAKPSGAAYARFMWRNLDGCEVLMSAAPVKAYVEHGCIGIRTTHGKNLICVPSATGTTTGYYVEFTIANARMASFTELQEGVTYTLSMDVTSSVEPFRIAVGAGAGTYAKDVYNDSAAQFTSGRVSVTFTPTAAQLASGNLIALRVPRLSTSTAFTYSVSNIQLEYGDTATSYEPYVNTTIPIDLQGHQLRSLPDGTKDELHVAAGNVVLTQRVGAYTVTGNETVGDATQLGSYRRVRLSWVLLDNAKSIDNANSGWCTKAPFAVGYGAQSTHVYTHGAHVYAFAEATTDAAVLTAYTGATLLYPLANPQTIDLGSIDMPTVEDGDTVEVVGSAVVPTIGAAWETSNDIVFAGTSPNKTYENQSETIYYRQIEDTESWGSEHERKLFIPYQNPVP